MKKKVFYSKKTQKTLDHCDMTRMNGSKYFTPHD